MLTFMNDVALRIRALDGDHLVGVVLPALDDPLIARLRIFTPAIHTLHAQAFGAAGVFPQVFTPAGALASDSRQPVCCRWCCR